MQLLTKPNLIGSLFLALLVVPMPGLAQEQINRRFPASATGSVDVVNTAGSVRVVGWDRNEIQVTGTLGRGTERLDIDADGNGARIEVVIPRNARNVRGSDLVVRVPVRNDVYLQTVSADIDVQDIRGFVEARAVSGGVRVSGTPPEVLAYSTSGDIGVNVRDTRTVRATSTSGSVNIEGSVAEEVVAEAVSGDVTVDARTAEVRAKSVSGTVELHEVRERFTASTVSGDMVLAGEGIAFASAESVSGDVRFSGSFARGGNVTLESHSGDLDLLLPAEDGLDVDITTFSGDIQNAFGAEVRRTSRHGPGRELRFSIGRGGARLVAKTFSGDVKLRRR